MDRLHSMEHSIRSFWADHVRAANSCELSLAQYARDHAVPLKQLYAWRSKFKVEGTLSVPSKLHQRFFVFKNSVSARIKAVSPQISPNARLGAASSSFL